MGGAYIHVPQSISQYMMNQQNTQQQQVAPWMQTPQTPPISIPWSIPASQQPEVIRFTGGEATYGPIVHQKRKLEALDTDIYRTKQFITEEKMTAHFKALRISANQSESSSLPSTSTDDRTSFSRKQSDMDLDVDAANTINADQADNLHPRLIFSEELKRMQQEPILPSTLLSKLEKPSLALVLWEPPSKHLRILPTRDSPTPIPSTSDDNNNNNNNSEVILNLNHASSDSALSTFEPMEL